MCAPTPVRLFRLGRNEGGHADRDHGLRDHPEAVAQYETKVTAKERTLTAAERTTEATVATGQGERTDLGKFPKLSQEKRGEVSIPKDPVKAAAAIHRHFVGDRWKSLQVHLESFSEKG